MLLFVVRENLRLLNRICRDTYIFIRYDVTEIKGRYCVDYGKDHIFYDYDNNVISDYEDSDLKKIPFNKPHFIVMVYGLEDRMRTVIQQDNFLRGIYVDNDHGLIVPIEEFIKLGMPIDRR